MSNSSTIITPEAFKAKLETLSAACSLVDNASATQLLCAVAGIPLEEFKQQKFCFQTIPNFQKPYLKSVDATAAMASHRTATFGQCASWLRDANALSSGGLSGVYFTVNETDGGGRKAKNVTRVRALFVELDHGALTSDHLDQFVGHFKCSALVESSPGKVHAYWFLRDSAECPLEKFGPLQLLLASRFAALRADTSCHDLSRVLRIPGFYHMKSIAIDSPWVVRLHHCDATWRYSVNEILGHCGIDAEFITAFKTSSSIKPQSSSPAASAVAGKYAEFQGAGDGSRNDSMFHYCLEHLLRNRGMNADEALGSCIVVNQYNAPPLDRSELEAIVASAWRFFLDRGGVSRQDASVAQVAFDDGGAIIVEADGTVRGSASDNLLPDGADSWDQRNFQFDFDREIFAAPSSDAAICERISQKYGDVLRINPRTGVYFFRDGLWNHHTGDGAGESFFRPHYEQTILGLRSEMQFTGSFLSPRGGFDPVKCKYRIDNLLSVSTYEKLLKGLRRHEDLFTDFIEYDAAVGRVPVVGGVVDLTSGKLLDDSPTFKFTRRCPVEFDASATCPLFEQFISDLMLGDVELCAYLQRVCGLVLAGDMSEQCLFVLHGYGGNGKSTFLNVLDRIFGGFAGELSADSIGKGSGVSLPAMSDFAQSYGKRLLKVSELAEGAEWNESLIKSLAGKDKVRGKLYHKDTFEYQPTFTIMVRANHEPVVTGTDDGIWARLKMIPFKASFRGSDAEDKHIEDKLAAELPGIFNWIAAGYRSYLDVGLGVPESCDLLVRTLRAKNEPEKEFIADYCVKCDVSEGLTVQEFLDAYNKWASNEGRTRMNLHSLPEKLSRLGIDKARLRKDGERSRCFGLKFSVEGLARIGALEADKIADLTRKKE